MTAVAAVAASALIAANTTGADADVVNRQLTANCSLGGLSTPVTLPFSSNDSPDPVTAGGAVSLAVTPSTPSFPTFTADVTSVVLSIPVPAQVSVGSVTFSGANMAGAATITPTVVTITYTGSVAQGSVNLGTFTLNGAVGANTGGQTISWAVPSTVTISLRSQGTGLVAACTPDAGTLNTTAIGTAATTTSTSTTSTTTTTRPTTTTSTTTTTRPSTTTTTTSTTTTSTTTTTRPSTTTTTTSSTTTTRPSTTTTTTRPSTTTTTTRPPTTTTTRPTTTTTRPTTTTTRNIIQVIFCIWFRIFC